MSTFTSRHVARKSHVCGDGHLIRPGETYLRHVATPNDNDLGNTGWWHLNECAECAARYGRSALIEGAQK